MDAFHCLHPHMSHTFIKLAAECNDITHPDRVNNIVNILMGRATSSELCLHEDKITNCITTPEAVTLLRRQLTKYRSDLLPQVLHVAATSACPQSRNELDDGIITEYSSKSRSIFNDMAGIPATIIFVNSTSKAISLTNVLLMNTILKDYIQSLSNSCLSDVIQCLHSKTENKQEILSAFRAQKCKVLIATDHIARGMNLPHVDNVIQAEFAQNVVDFIVSTLYISC